MAAVAFGSMFLAVYLNGGSPKAEAEAANEFEVTFASELHDGDKRVLKVGTKDDEVVLIAKYQGKIYAVGNFCSHFGVPLDGGVLFDDKVLCPAHAAGFSIITG
jgi:nitrite reductase/ring-hydroxylating ferredoxin subunit